MVIPVTLPGQITQELTVLFTPPNFWVYEYLKNYISNNRTNYLNNETNSIKHMLKKGVSQLADK
jgi:hypothetical protein